MTIPLQFRAGDTVQWRNAATVDALGNAITPGLWTLTTYFRSQATGAGGITVTASVNASLWESAISAATSLSMVPGDWYWQARASNGTDAHTIGTGTSTVLAALSYAGAAAVTTAARNRRSTWKQCRLQSGRLW